MRKKTQKEHHAESARSTGGKNQPVIITGIGVGAGGSKSLKSLLPSLPSGQDTAYMLIRHPETSVKDLTIRQLKNLTGLEVVEATEGMPVLADRLHVVPSDRFLNIGGGTLTLTPPVQCDGFWMPIDHFFCSLAADQKRHACGIVLSGHGSDGTLGLSEIKAAGGTTIVEDPTMAEHPGMSQSAIDAGVAGSVLPVETMAGQISTLAKRASDEVRKDLTVSPGLEPDLRAIIDILRIKVGHDFRCYRPNTLIRRVHRRMSLGKIETFADYARFLTENPDEIDQLQKDLQIGVTEFFRQPPAWELLNEKVIAPLVDRTRSGSEIRVWVPGCSTGQEVYSLTMMLAERIEQSGKDISIQVFATDSDSAALSIARAGSYSEEDVSGGVSSEYLKRFFTRKDNRFQIIKAIRERIVFAPQNITADPPFSRLDLISCRNLIMYLEQSMQQKIFAIFHFALHEGGFLFLGSAETIGERTDLFESVSKKWRIYRRIGVGRSLGIEMPVHSIGGSQCLHAKIPAAPSAPRITLASTAQQVLMDRFAPACVMIDRKLQVLYVHGAVEEYLTFPAGELTMRVVDMAREGLRARLRGAIGKCIETGRPVLINARVRRGNKSIPVKVTVSPLRYPRNAEGLLLVTFEDQHLPAIKLQRHMAEESDLRQLEDELRITREELQSTIEQLEGSNDQLKASNEEVTASNEELQAANEELETSKEELQSLNEELNTSNTRLNEKVEELENNNNDIVNLLSSTAIATLFLDKDLRIGRFTPAITGLFSLIPSDVGRSITDVLRRFTDEALLSDARRVLADLSPLTREVQSDNGRWYMRRITPYRTQDDRIEGVVITFVDFTERKRAEEALNDVRQRQAVILDSIADGFFALDRDWRVIHINDPALGHFGKKRDEMMGRNLFDVFPGSRGSIFEIEYRRAMETGNPVRFEAPSIPGEKTLEVYVYPGMDNLTILFRDITERDRMAEALHKAHERATWLARFPEENPHPVVRVSTDGKVLYCNPASAANSVWGCKEGEPLPDAVLPFALQAMAQKEEIQQEIQLGERFYGITVAPFPAEAYANIYGRSITKRRQAKEAVEKARKSLEWERNILQSVMNGAINAHLVYLDRDFNFIRVNETYARSCGYAPEDLVGKNHFDLYPHAENKAIFTHVRDSGIPAEFHDKPFVFPDQPERGITYWDWTLMPVLDATGRVEGLVFSLVETTERKRAEITAQHQNAIIDGINKIFRETLLCETEAELGEVCLSTAAEGLTDSKMGFIGQIGPDGDLHDIAINNPGWDLCKMNGVTGHRLLPRNFKIHGVYGRVLKDGKSLLTNDPASHPDSIGLPSDHPPLSAFLGVPFIRSGKTVGMIAVGNRDGGYMPEQQRTLEALAPAIQQAFSKIQTDEALRESEERLRLFIKHAPASLAMFDGEMRYLSVSKHWLSDYGFGDRDILGMSHYEISPSIPAKWKEAHRHGLAGEVVRADADRFQRADGSVQWVQWEIHPWYKATGVIGGIVIFTEDITERKQADASLLKKTEQLEAANKELESFSYSVSHDLRTPLRAIEGYSRMILRKYADNFNTDALEKFNVIRKNTQMMGQLIDDLLAFSRMGRAQLSKSRLDMNVLIREIWKDVIGNDTDRRIDFRILELPPGLGDPGLIRQVLTNMLANAVKFTKIREETVIEAGGYVKDDENVYYIRDNGAGFDMEYYGKLFGVFQRLHHHNDFEGTGVGLAIVQRIIHRHGGRVWAEGKVDEGACFYFTLPGI